MIGHHSSYIGWRIHHVWWPRSESLDDVAVHGGVTVCDFIDEYINNEFGSDSVPIRLQRRIGSMHIQFTSPQTKFKCEHNQCVLNAH